MNFMRKLLAGRQGYTIDQTILIVVIIAILITLIIITIGWQLINRSSGTKLGAQLRQVEDAVGQFYSDQHMWPHQAYTNTVSAVNNALAMANDSTITWQTSIDTTLLKNLLTGLKVSGGNVMHGFGAGGAVTMMPGKANAAQALGSNTFMFVKFANMPLSEAQEADKAIDGVLGATLGRVVYVPTASECIPTAVNGTVGALTAVGTATTVNVCFAANTIQ